MQILSRPRFNVNYRSSGTSLKEKKKKKKMKVTGMILFSTIYIQLYFQEK